MKPLDISDPSTSLQSIVELATQGEEVMLLRDGSPFARVVPAVSRSRKTPWTLEQLREWRKGNILGPDLTIKQLIEEGRP